MKRTILWLLLSAVAGFGQIASYAPGSVDCFSGSNTSPQSCGVDLGSSANRAAVVSIRSGGNSPGYTTGCTLGGQTATLIDERFFTGVNGNSGTEHLYYFGSSLPTGVNTLQCTSSGGIGWAADVTVLSGVAQTGQPEAHGTGGVDCHSATLCSVSLTTITANAWLIMGQANGTGNISCTAQTIENCGNKVGVNGAGAGMATRGPIASPGSTPLTFSISNGADVATAMAVISLAPVTTPTFTITPTAVPNGHAGNITLTFVGNGTSWNNGTTVFTPSGVANVTKISQNVTGAAAATVVITTGAGTGTLTITESVTGTAAATTTVFVPTFSINPTSGSINSTPTLTITGTNTLWTQETAAGLFTVSGGVAASIGTPTITTDSAGTVVLTTGTAPGALTITDTSTGKTATYTANTTVSFTATPTTIPNGHAANLTITLAGSNTLWNNGTTVFTLSGVANVTKVSQNISSASAATIVVTTGAGVGPLTITETVTGSTTATVTVAVPTLSADFSSGNLRSVQTLAMVGTNTIWALETAAGLFTVSGSTGASIGTPTITTNTAGTVALTIVNAGTITITDTSTGKTMSFVAGAGGGGSTTGYVIAQ